MKTIQYAAAASLLALLTACSSDDLLDTSYQQDPLAVHLNATAGRNVIARSNPTDDTQQTVFNDDDRISVGTNDQTAVIYKKGNGQWTPESGYLKWTKNPLNFEAFYPVDGSTSMSFFTVPNDQSTIDKIKKADYMTFSGSKDKPATAAGTIDIEMARKMARVVIDSIKFNDQYEAGYSVTAITVNNNTFGYTDGEPVYISDDGYFVTPYKADNGKYYALLGETAVQTEVPTQQTTFLTVTVKANDADETETGDVLTVKGIPALKAGYSYSYTLTVGKNKAEISSVTVKPWNDGGPIIADNGEGNAEEIKAQTVISSDGTTATITVPELATNKAVQEAISEALTYGNVTTWIVKGDLTDEMQTSIATALAGKTITLYLPQLETAKLVEELNAENLTVYCGCYVANNTCFVYNTDGLQAWRNHTDSDKSINLTLEKDIVLALAEEATNNWTSVGTASDPYTGTVEGNGYSITGMTINQTTSCAGFIGCLKNGAVRNLKMKKISITCSQQEVGGIAGRTMDSNTIENCAIEGGTITSTYSSAGSMVGGIVGRVWGGGTSTSSNKKTSIIACYNTAAVTGSYYVAGIVSCVYSANYADIIGCYNAGYIKRTNSGKNEIAGIVGCESANTVTWCCYNTGGTNADWAINGFLNSGSKGCNYWSSNHTYPNGPSSTGGLDTGMKGGTKITDESEWITAMETMNSWLSQKGYNYRYKQNTDELTKATLPLMIVKAQ